MKLCTNRRWNSRKPTNSGAEVISVAARITAQSIPWSLNESTRRQTVSGREFTEPVTKSGQRKLFQ